MKLKGELMMEIWCKRIERVSRILGIVWRKEEVSIIENSRHDFKKKIPPMIETIVQRYLFIERWLSILLNKILSSTFAKKRKNCKKR